MIPLRPSPGTCFALAAIAGLGWGDAGPVAAQVHGSEAWICFYVRPAASDDESTSAIVTNRLRRRLQSMKLHCPGELTPEGNALGPGWAAYWVAFHWASASVHHLHQLAVHSQAVDEDQYDLIVLKTLVVTRKSGEEIRGAPEPFLWSRNQRRGTLGEFVDQAVKQALQELYRAPTGRLYLHQP